jgi:hypothetical protein
MLTPTDPYGLEVFLDNKPGYFFRIVVWRHSEKGEGLVVVSAPDANLFYRAGAPVAERTSSGWEKIVFPVSVPAGYPDSTIKIYLWNNSEGDIYFDDICITGYK